MNQVSHHLHFSSTSFLLCQVLYFTKNGPKCGLCSAILKWIFTLENINLQTSIFLLNIYNIRSTSMTFWCDIEHSCIICHHTHWKSISILVTQSKCIKNTLYGVAVRNITLSSTFVRNQTKMWAPNKYSCVECAFESLKYT